MASIGGQAIPRRALLLVGTEGTFIFFTLLLARLVRFPMNGSLSASLHDPGVVSRLLRIVFVCVISFYYYDLYDLKTIRSAAATCVRSLPGIPLLILLDDGYPIIYRQSRTGLNGKPFKIIKFRTMRKAPPESTPSWTGDGDPRITRLGRQLRKFRLDELPQFFNVICGDMSLVGPRPEQPYFCNVLEGKIPYFAYRHTVRPGITGWAQVKYGYGATTEDAWRKVELDLFYIKHLSIFLDFAIMFETAKVVLFGRGK